MASTHNATEVVLAPQPGLRGLFRAIVAVTAALVVGMGIGNVIDSGRAGVESVASQSVRVVETEEGLSELSIGARQITGNTVEDPRWIGASEELHGSLQTAGLTATQQATADRLDGLAGFYNPDVSGAETNTNAASSARLSGLAEFYAQPDTFSPELIWAVRNGTEPLVPQAVEQPGQLSPAADRPFGMQ